MQHTMLPKNFASEDSKLQISARSQEVAKSQKLVSMNNWAHAIFEIIHTYGSVKSQISMVVKKVIEDRLNKKVKKKL